MHAFDVEEDSDGSTHRLSEVRVRRQPSSPDVYCQLRALIGLVVILVAVVGTFKMRSNAESVSTADTSTTANKADIRELVPAEKSPHFNAQLARGLTSCERAAKDAVDTNYVPACDSSGGFVVKQCSSDKTCWCVDTLGQELPGTTLTMDLQETHCRQLLDHCTRGLADTCVTRPHGEGLCELVQTVGFFNMTSLRCEEKTIVGCKASEPSFSSEADCRQHCSGRETEKTCGADLETAQKWEATAIIGTFYPRCTMDGAWKAMQCGKYDCWCVDVYGVQYAGTARSHVSDSKEDAAGRCEMLRQTCYSCAGPGEERCTKALEAQGVNCIIGSCAKVAI